MSLTVGAVRLMASWQLQHVVQLEQPVGGLGARGHEAEDDGRPTHQGPHRLARPFGRPATGGFQLESPPSLGRRDHGVISIADHRRRHYQKTTPIPGARKRPRTQSRASDRNHRHSLCIIPAFDEPSALAFAQVSTREGVRGSGNRSDEVICFFRGPRVEGARAAFRGCGARAGPARGILAVRTVRIAGPLGLGHQPAHGEGAGEMSSLRPLRRLGQLVRCRPATRAGVGAAGRAPAVAGCGLGPGRGPSAGRVVDWARAARARTVTASARCSAPITS